MQLSIIDQATMKIEHEGHQSIITSIREFSKTKFISYDVNKNIIDPFKEINLFINTCLKRQQKQEIYDAYAVIFEEFGLKSLDVDKLFDCIQKQMKILRKKQANLFLTIKIKQKNIGKKRKKNLALIPLNSI